MDKQQPAADRLERRASRPFFRALNTIFRSAASRRTDRWLIRSCAILVLLTILLAVWTQLGDGTTAQEADVTTALATSTAPLTTAAATTLETTVPAPTTAETSAGTTAIPTASVPNDALFPGISQAITARWVFPLNVAATTPTIGVFGAARTSRRCHAGIDLYAPPGTEVFAMAGGIVREVDLFYENLWTIDVENRDGTTIRYTELKPLVKAGERVEQGQLLARLAKNSSGTCMLHLEIYATVNSGELTQIDNKDDYRYVPVKSRSYMRRSDLVDPSAVIDLGRIG